MSAGGEELFTKIGFDVSQAAGGIAQLATAIKSVEEQFVKLATATTTYNARGEATKVVLQGQTAAADNLKVSLKRLADGTLDTSRVVKQSFVDEEKAAKANFQAKLKAARSENAQNERRKKFVKSRKADLDAQLKAEATAASQAEATAQRRFAASVKESNQRAKTAAQIQTSLNREAAARQKATAIAEAASIKEAQAAELAAQRKFAASVRATNARIKESARLQAAVRKDIAAENRRAAASAKASAKIIANRNRETRSLAKAETAVQKFTLTWSTIGRIVGVQLLHNAISRLVRLMSEGISTAKEFNLRIAEIQTISQENQLSVDQWGDGLRRLSESFGFSVLDEAEGAYQTLSNQVAKGADTFKFLESANKLAAAGVATTTEAVNLLTSAVNAYGIPIRKTDEIAAKFFKTVELGRTRVGEMANIFGEVAVLAKQSGVSFEELLAAISFLTRQGIKTPKVLTQLRGIFVKFLKPTKEMTKLLRELGFATGEQAISTLKLLPLMVKITEKTKGASTEVAKIFSRVRSLSGGLAFTSDKLSDFADDLKKGESAQKSFARATDIVLKSTAKTIDIEVQKIKNFFIVELGQPLLDSIVAIGKEWGGLSVIVKSFAELLAAVLVPAIVLVSAKLAILAVANPFTAIVVGAGVAVVALNTYLAKQEELIRKAEEDERKSWEDRVKTAEKAVSDITDAVVTAIDERARLLDVEAAAIFGTYNEQAQAVIESTDAFNKAVAKTNKELVKNLKKEISGLNTSLKNTKKITADLSKLFNDIRLDVEDQIFTLKLDDANVQGKLDLIKTRISDLQGSVAIAVEQGDVSLLTSTFKEIRDLTVEEEKLRRKATDDREKISKKIAATELKSQKAILKLEEKSRRFFKTDNARKQKEIANKKAAIESETEKTIDGLKEELKKFQTNADTRHNIYIRLREFQIKQQNLVQKAIEANLKKEEAIRIEAAKKQALFAKVIRAEEGFEKFDLKDALKTEDEAGLIKILENRRRAIDDLAKAQIEAGAEITDVARLRARLADEEIAINNRINKLFILGKKEERDAAFAALKADLDLRKQQLQDINVSKVSLLDAATTIQKSGTFLDEFFTKLGRFGVKLTDTEANFRRLGESVENLPNLVENIASPEDAERVRNRIQQLVRDFGKIGVPTGTDAAKKAQLDLVQALTRINTEVNKQIELTPEYKKALAEVAQIEDIFKTSTDEATTSTEENTTALEKGKIAFNDLSVSIANATQKQLEFKKAITAAPVQLPTTTLPPKPFARGGQAHGSDSIPALLSPGEFVVNSKASRRFYSQLVAMNSSVRGFANGGPVSNTTVGDINVSMGSSGNESIDVQRIALLLNREIRRGTVKWRS